jgi:hypothetical protein
MECGDNKSKDKGLILSYIKENLPLVIVIIFGSILTSWVWWIWGIVYLGYSIIALLLYMKFICLYCLCYKTRSCHDGYHIIASRLFEPRKGKIFYTQFKRYVPVVYPIWFIPVPAAFYVLMTRFSWLHLGFVIIFCISGFVILPLLSQNQCRKCTNGLYCPRLVKETKREESLVKEF